MNWMWMLMLMMQAQEAERRRQEAEAQARAKAEADAQAARDAEAKRQAQIAQQRQTDAAAAQVAEKDRLSAVAKLPGGADPYGQYSASLNLDNATTQNASRTIGSSAPASPMGMPSMSSMQQPQPGSMDFSSFGRPAPQQQKAPSGLASMFSNATSPNAKQPGTQAQPQMKMPQSPASMF